MLLSGGGSLPRPHNRGFIGLASQTTLQQNRLSGFYSFSIAKRAQRCVIAAATSRTFYDILDVPQGSSARDIKAAYRKKALKLHPDVNKAPDAQRRFMEAKAAFETLSDGVKRSDYDKRLRMGFGSSASSGSWGSSASSSSSGRGSTGSAGTDGFDDFFNTYGRGTRPKPKPEDNYTFDDLMRDLDKELNSWVSEKKAKDGGKPKSLWEELEDIGGEFVDFLEDTLGVKETEDLRQRQRDATQGSEQPSSSSSYTSSSKSGNTGSKSSSQGGSSTSGGSGAQSRQSAADSSNKSGQGGSSSASSGRAATGGASSPSRPPKSADDDINEMLAALKKKLGKT